MDILAAYVVVIDGQPIAAHHCGTKEVALAVVAGFAGTLGVDTRNAMVITARHAQMIFGLSTRDMAFVANPN